MIRLLALILSLLAVPALAGAPAGSGIQPDLSAYATKTQLSTKADLSTLSGYATTGALASATAGVVKTFNGAVPDTNGNVTLTIPVAYTDAQAVAAATAAGFAKTANGVSFLSGFTPSSPGTWANLLATTPCNSGRLSSYAVVLDLYSAAAATNEVIRCGVTGTTYAWKPQRENFAASVTVSGGTMTLTCGVSPPIMFVSGTLTSAQTFALSATGCWPGASFQVANNAALGAFAITFTGLVGGATKALSLNSRQTYYYDYTTGAWNSF